ncbi:hypothetical protein SAMN04488122_3623 [Chitinophaga arvensicola]|uniref:Uncharacterized protein n=1 Tax=Chitinophaga arvensicola TaxID=29529 RepID=A0A1I0S5F0_9BACT|nr:hypothetical protein SAMN04488122_3623 [Chitinophaga arvensicola]
MSELLLMICSISCIISTNKSRLQDDDPVSGYKKEPKKNQKFTLPPSVIQRPGMSEAPAST